MVKLRVFFPQEMQNEHAKAPKIQRFDIFKGFIDAEGHIKKIRSVGSARLTEGYSTYIVQLKSLVGQTFYMLPDRAGSVSERGYSILTREDSTMPSRRYFWNKVGDGIALPNPNLGLIHLCWDIFGAEDIFMSLEPMVKFDTTVTNNESPEVA